MTVPKGIIGVVHVPAMPTDPAYKGGGFERAMQWSLRDAKRLVDGGVQSLIVENFGSAPFFKGDASSRLAPHAVAFLTVLLAKIRQAHPDVLLGVNCLRNDAISAMGIAAALSLDFIRVNVHTGAYLTDQGVIEGEAARTLRYRQQLDAQHVSILADVLVKHAAPLAPLDVQQAVQDTTKRGMADAVIVTGTGTGAPISIELLQQIHQYALGAPVILGSGVNTGNLPTLAPHAHAAIVGTSLKEGGQVLAPVDQARVQEMVSLDVWSS